MAILVAILDLTHNKLLYQQAKYSIGFIDPENIPLQCRCKTRLPICSRKTDMATFVFLCPSWRPSGIFFKCTRVHDGYPAFSDWGNVWEAKYAKKVHTYLTTKLTPKMGIFKLLVCRMVNMSLKYFVIMNLNKLYTRWCVVACNDIITWLGWDILQVGYAKLMFQVFVLPGHYLDDSLEFLQQYCCQ